MNLSWNFRSLGATISSKLAAYQAGRCDAAAHRGPHATMNIMHGAVFEGEPQQGGRDDVARVR